MVVVSVESPAQNDASGLGHARATLTRYLHDLSEVTSESPVTETVPDEAVGLRTKRLPHHRMMSGNV